MDLLNYGIRNESSRQLRKRIGAKAALRIVMLRANLYEWYLNKRWSGIPEAKDVPDEMLCQLRARIKKQAAEPFK